MVNFDHRVLYVVNKPQIICLEELAAYTFDAEEKSGSWVSYIEKEKQLDRRE
jgi:hypothetical protein